MASISDVINSLVHPKVVEALLLSPTFTSKLPAGTKLHLRPNFPVQAAEGSSAAVVSALAGEKYTWAVVDERAGSKIGCVMSGAIVELGLSDADFDALDEATDKGGFEAFVKDGEMQFKADGQDVPADDSRHATFTTVMNATSIASASGTKLVLSNGPRWVSIDTNNGIVISKSYGQRKDGSPIAHDRLGTSMYGILVSLAFENVITRDAMASLQAARASAAAAAPEAPAPAPAAPSS